MTKGCQLTCSATRSKKRHAFGDYEDGGHSGLISQLDQGLALVLPDQVRVPAPTGWVKQQRPRGRLAPSKMKLRQPCVESTAPKSRFSSWTIGQVIGSANTPSRRR
jgi:hypothetical protein